MIDAPDFDARLSVYLAPIADAARATYAVDPSVEMALCDPRLDIDGLMDSLSRQRYSSRYHIHALSLDTPQSAAWDIGYSLVTRPQHLVDVPLEHLHAVTRPPLSMADLLRSKFLLMLKAMTWPPA